VGRGRMAADVTLQAIRDHVEAQRGYAVDLIPVVLPLMDGHERLCEIHRQALLRTARGDYPYCVACVKPWPCESARAIEDAAAEAIEAARRP
jgi:hypothetical protein